MKSVANEYVHFELVNDVVEGIFTKATIWNYDVAREVVSLRLLICGKNAYPLYLDVRKVTTIDLKARQYMSSARAMKNLTAGALRIDSSLGKMAGNFFLVINKPQLPLKLFNSKEPALIWLEQFKVDIGEQG